jgi:hypothetical protein
VACSHSLSHLPAACHGSTQSFSIITPHRQSWDALVTGVTLIYAS